MIRIILIGAALLASSAFAQATPEQQCQAKCGQAMNQCMMPCSVGHQDSAKPEARAKAMACVQKCGMEQKPCMDGCKKKSKP
jgi:hypothetical protein